MPAPEATRTLTAKGRQTRAAIEQAARKLFAERGFHGTTLADITSAAGKSAAVFYRYFADKEDLLAALAQSVRHAIDPDVANRTADFAVGTDHRHAARIGIACLEISAFRQSHRHDAGHIVDVEFGEVLAIGVRARPDAIEHRISGRLQRCAGSVRRVRDHPHGAPLNQTPPFAGNPPPGW